MSVERKPVADGWIATVQRETSSLFRGEMAWTGDPGRARLFRTSADAMIEGLRGTGKVAWRECIEARPARIFEITGEVEIEIVHHRLPDRDEFVIERLSDEKYIERDGRSVTDDLQKARVFDRGELAEMFEGSTSPFVAWPVETRPRPPRRVIAIARWTYESKVPEREEDGTLNDVLHRIFRPRERPTVKVHGFTGTIEGEDDADTP